MRQLSHRHAAGRLRCLVIEGALAGAAVLASGAAFAGQSAAMGNRGNGYSVDHDGVYLAQQIGKCMNGTGACYFGGQCPGGEWISGRYVDGRVFCHNFYPPAPYPPSLAQRLLGIP